MPAENTSNAQNTEESVSTSLFSAADVKQREQGEFNFERRFRDEGILTLEGTMGMDYENQFDVNVVPNKRQLLLHAEDDILNFLRQTMQSIYRSSDAVFQADGNQIADHFLPTSLTASDPTSLSTTTPLGSQAPAAKRRKSSSGSLMSFAQFERLDAADNGAAPPSKSPVGVNNTPLSIGRRKSASQQQQVPSLAMYAAKPSPITPPVSHSRLARREGQSADGGTQNHFEERDLADLSSDKVRRQLNAKPPAAPACVGARRKSGKRGRKSDDDGGGGGDDDDDDEDDATESYEPSNQSSDGDEDVGSSDEETSSSASNAAVPSPTAAGRRGNKDHQRMDEHEKKEGEGSEDDGSSSSSSSLSLSVSLEEFSKKRKKRYDENDSSVDDSSSATDSSSADQLASPPKIVLDQPRRLSTSTMAPSTPSTTSKSGLPSPIQSAASMDSWGGGGTAVGKLEQGDEKWVNMDLSLIDQALADAAASVPESAGTGTAEPDANGGSSVGGSGGGAKFYANINEHDDKQCAEELQREFKLDYFNQLQVIGQFNLGFIVARLNNDLFLIDQHASDEKYNYEQLKKKTTLKTQPLIRPQMLDLSPEEEEIIRDNEAIFLANGFAFQYVDDAAPRHRVRLTSKPFSKNVQLGVSDVHEIITLLRDQPGIMCRPSRIAEMLASRACRSSIMIGTALTRQQMQEVVRHMGQEMDQPFNCPHGRPTIRHLINLDRLPQPPKTDNLLP